MNTYRENVNAAGLLFAWAAAFGLMRVLLPEAHPQPWAVLVGGGLLYTARAIYLGLRYGDTKEATR